MLTPGDVVELDLGAPAGFEAGLLGPAVVVTADRILRGGPNVIQVVPLTRMIRDSRSEIVVEPDEYNGLSVASAAQRQHLRSVATTRVSAQIGNMGPTVLRQIRDTVTTIIDG